MSPPNQDKQENRGEETLKYGIEEQGENCPDPALHQESSEKGCKAVLFTQAALGEFVPVLHNSLYFMFGTKHEIEKQFIKIKEFEETKNPPGIPQIAFPACVSPDDPRDTVIFAVCLSGEKIKLQVEVDNNTCHLQLHTSSQDLEVSVENIKVKSNNCIAGKQAQDMRLHGPNIPASILFSLRCKKSQILTPTNISLTAKSCKNRSHAIKKQFSVCFYDKHASCSKNSPNPGNYRLSPLRSEKKLALEDNHCKLCQKIKNWPSFIQWFVTNGVLDKRFLKFDELSEERKGEILRHLYNAENIFPKFIEALGCSDNEEVVEFLHQCISSMGNQNSSL